MSMVRTDIKLAQSDAEIEACYPVLSQLRPQVQENEFMRAIKRMSVDGYQLSYLRDGGVVQTVAGFRISESFGWGRYLYVDDLVTIEGARSKGYGEKMFAWLVTHACAQRCQQLHLESGVQRYAAHKFYLRNGMRISSHHFQLFLDRSNS